MQNPNFVICDADLMRQYGEVLSYLRENPDATGDVVPENKFITLYNYNCMKLLEVEGLYEDEKIDEMVINFNDTFENFTMKKYSVYSEGRVYLYIIRKN